MAALRHGSAAERQFAIGAGVTARWRLPAIRA
jgi:hypothetical protein